MVDASSNHELWPWCRCVFYGKPLLESGTEGTKFNTMVVLPNETVSYDEGEADAPDGEAIPMCTLRSFPSTVVHCIEWSRSEFNDRFESDVAAVQNFLGEKSIAGKTLDECTTEFTEQYVEYDMCDANDLSKVIQPVFSTLILTPDPTLIQGDASCLPQRRKPGCFTASTPCLDACS